MTTQEVESGFLAHSESGGPCVVMIPDVWGLSDHYRDLAGRLAREGFVVLAVDPYRKTGQPEISSPAEAQAWIRGLSDPVMLETIQEGRDWLCGQPACRGRKVGVTGFCMGGQYAILAACSGGFDACVPFYGMLRYADDLGPPDKPRSPLAALADLPCPLLGLYGAEDPLIPVADVAELEEALAKSGRSGEVRLYPGAGHAFMNETRPALHRPEAAADAWPRMLDFFRQHLA